MKVEAEYLSSLIINRADVNTLLPEYFRAHREEFEWLQRYHDEFGKLPSEATFRSEFSDFPFVATERDAEWLGKEVRRDFLRVNLAADVSEFAKSIDDSPEEALQALITRTSEYTVYQSNVSGRSVLIKNVEKRINEVDRRRAMTGLVGITHGFKLLDEFTNGTQPGELEGIFGRTGEGKTHVGIWGAYAAVRQGKRVVYVSPEMSEHDTGVIGDAIEMNASASKMLSGKYTNEEFDALRDSSMRMLKRADEYADLIFFETTTRRFNSADIRRMIKTEKPDIVVCDGVTLIDPMVPDRDIRKRITNGMEELKSIVTQTDVPIRFVHQANRLAEVTTRTKKPQTVGDVIPELYHMAESDSIAQYSNRVFAIKRVGNLMYIAVRKNRNSASGFILRVTVDFDRGQFSLEKEVTSDTDLTAVEPVEGANADPTIPF